MGRWTDVFVGAEIGPLEFPLTEELCRRFVEGSGNALEVHRELADPTIAGNLAIYVLGSRYPGPIIHSHQELKFFAPVRIGETVTGRGTITRKELRRDKAYVAIDCDLAVGAEPVWWARMTCVWPEVHLRGEV